MKFGKIRPVNVQAIPLSQKLMLQTVWVFFLFLALYDDIGTWSAQAQQLHPPVVVQVLFSEEQLISNKTKNFLKGKGKGSKTTFQIEDELRCYTKAQCKTNKDYFEF